MESNRRRLDFQLCLIPTAGAPECTGQVVPKVRAHTPETDKLEFKFHSDDLGQVIFSFLEATLGAVRVELLGTRNEAIYEVLSTVPVTQ